VVGVGDNVPAVTVFAAPGEAVRLDELAATSTVLFLFYLFDWSGT
jgi:peroxiredoxin